MNSLAPLLQNVIQLFGVDTDVQDTVYSKISGVDQQSDPTTRTVFAAVDLSNPRMLRQIFGGSVSNGSVGVYTLGDDLYFVDQGETRQSYILWGGYQYKILALSDWTTQCGVKVYLAERHVTQDKV